MSTKKLVKKILNYKISKKLIDYLIKIKKKIKLFFGTKIIASLVEYNRTLRLFKC